MYDSIRRATGWILAAAAAVLCWIPVIFSSGCDGDIYRSGDSLKWTLQEIIPERDGPVHVNDADAEELTALPGVGETIAALILDERRRNGPYYYAEDLEAVRGIGPRTVEKFRYLLDLTTDEREE